jgi:hypothetical protein
VGTSGKHLDLEGRVDLQKEDIPIISFAIDLAFDYPFNLLLLI